MTKAPSAYWLLALVFVLGFAVGPDVHAARTPKIKGQDCPIVLVHGFIGWGRDEMSGYLYWGGSNLDIEEYLSKKGFKTVTASVGPISSVHDRACELFWQLHGGRVDYGEAHAKKFRHHRYGKTFPSLLAEWNEQHPVHFVTHSMGGQTARYLSELLARDYFKVGTNERWILSISTISTPHNGTTLTAVVGRIFWNSAEEILTGLCALSGTRLDHLYDFDLQQWGIERRADESIGRHLKRILDTVGDTRDISSWDLSPQGARELNEQIRVFPDVYYMSYTNAKTYQTPLLNLGISKLGMNPALYLPSNFMCTYGGDAIPASQHKLWGRNDGIVNTVSMIGPGNSPFEVSRSGGIKKGFWTRVGNDADKDHLQMVGHYVDKEWLTDFYGRLAKRLESLSR